MGAAASSLLRRCLLPAAAEALTRVTRLLGFPSPTPATEPLLGGKKGAAPAAAAKKKIPEKRKKRVLVPIAAGAEPLEVVAAADVLTRAGASVAVAAVGGEGGTLLVEVGSRVMFVADGRVADFAGECFDLIALPGGMAGSIILRDCGVLQETVTKHANKGGLIGAIGAAPAVVLAPWGLLKGFKATCHPSCMEDFPLDVSPVKSRVVVDRNVTTSQGPGTALEFGLALIEQLYGKAKMETVMAAPLLVRPIQGVVYTMKELNPMKWICGTTPQVLVPVANGTEEMESNNLIDILRRAGAAVNVASVEDKLQIVTRHQKFRLVADILMDEAAEMQFDLIVLPGGLPGALKFSSTAKLISLLKKQAASNRLYGAICASPAYVLEPHGLLKGKKATAYPPMAHLLSDQSEIDNRVLVDGNLITSRAPGTATEFALCIVEKLFGREKALGLAKNVVFMSQ